MSSDLFRSLYTFEFAPKGNVEKFKHYSNGVKKQRENVPMDRNTLLRLSPLRTPPQGALTPFKRLLGENAPALQTGDLGKDCKYD